MNVGEIIKLNEAAELLSDALKRIEKSYTGDIAAFMLASDVRVALSMIDAMLRQYDADGKRKV